MAREERKNGWWIASRGTAWVHSRVEILATSDLHGVTGVRLDVLAREHGCAALLIAGDFLNLTGRGTPGEQARAVTAWLQDLAARIPVVACSGNHDATGTHGADWLREVAGNCQPAGRLTTDGGHAVLDGLVVSAVPYWHLPGGFPHRDWLRDRVRRVWVEGSLLAAERKLPWAVLHHEPPDGLAVAANGGFALRERGAPPQGWCRHWIELYRPDYVFSGHLHEAPLARGGSWAARVPETGTWCFNAGRIGRESGMVILDTAGRVARWYPSCLSEACRTLDLGPAAGMEAPAIPPDSHGP